MSELNRDGTFNLVFNDVKKYTKRIQRLLSQVDEEYRNYGDQQKAEVRDAMIMLQGSLEMGTEALRIAVTGGYPTTWQE